MSIAGACRGTPSRVDSCGVRMTGSSDSIAASTIRVVVLAKDVVQGASRRSRRVSRPGEALGGQIGRLEEERLVADGADALEVDDRVARQDAEIVGDELRAASTTASDTTRVARLRPRAAEGRADREVAADRGVDALARDERAATLVARDQAALLELREGLAERRPADVEELAQLALGRQSRARRPRAGPDPPLGPAGDDRVQRFLHAMAPRIAGR